MEFAVYVLWAAVVIVGLILWVLADGQHSTGILWCVWLGVVLAATAVACWQQQRIWSRDLPPHGAVDDRTAKGNLDATDKPDSTPKNDVAIVPSTPQSVQSADVPDVSSDKQHDATPPAPQATPAAPAADTRPLYEHPTPEYIARILSAKFGDALELAEKQFCGKRVSWEGRLSSVIAGPARTLGCPGKMGGVALWGFE